MLVFCPGSSALPLRVIGGLCSMIVALPGHLCYCVITIDYATYVSRENVSPIVSEMGRSDQPASAESRQSLCRRLHSELSND